MTLNFLRIAKGYTYILTMVKGILFSYCLLTSLCIKAALDNNIFRSINIDSNEEKWAFMFVPPSNKTQQIEDVCYIAMMDEAIIDSEGLNEQMDCILKVVQNNNIEEDPTVNSCQSREVCLMNNLLDVEIGDFLRALNSGHRIHTYASTPKYAYACVIVFTVSGKKEKVVFKIEKIELNNKVYNKDLMINGFSNGRDILKPVLASYKHMRLVYDDIFQVNNCVCNEMPDMNRDAALDDNEEPDAYHRDIGLLNKDDNSAIEPKNNSAKSPEIQNKKDTLFCSGVNNTENTRRSVTKSYRCDTCGKELSSKRNLSKHMEIHVRGKDFICSKCDGKFFCRHHLITYMNSHVSQRKFKCLQDGCNKIYNRKYSLRRHIENCHNKNNFKFLRNDCDKVLRQENDSRLPIEINVNELHFH
ncbi:MAG: C2H2-type zinc finger protein [Candidatus Endonucleobacter bathymodioli]|uniref:C2H2-type zinc finger protein n=1 Tax=Candidatus Endonucleibacter bathymodioli TaxID=539814 RepID=A0AA90NX25_9GAMM|nr:C2H2-type zinc finger protein [Candidatus Endonucleobacter bathymodioli]